MKPSNLRQKYNTLLQKFIRLFSLSGVAFVLTACYGCPYTEYDVEGQVYGEKNEPLEDMQVVVRTFNDFGYERPDTVYTDKAGYYHSNYGVSSFGGDCLEVIVHDPNGEYESDSVHVGYGQMKVEEEDSWGGYYSVKRDFTMKKK